LYLTDEEWNGCPDKVIRSLYLGEQVGFNEVKGQLCEAFQIHDEGVVFKVDTCIEW
jgi:hypothetical protein